MVISFLFSWHFFGTVKSSTGVCFLFVFGSWDRGLAGKLPKRYESGFLCFFPFFRALGFRFRFSFLSLHLKFDILRHLILHHHIPFFFVSFSFVVSQEALHYFITHPLIFLLFCVLFINLVCIFFFLPGVVFSLPSICSLHFVRLAVGYELFFLF